MKKNELFYTKTDKQLFKIIHDFNSTVVKEMVSQIEEKAQEFAKICGVDYKLVRTFPINNSSRYSGKRVLSLGNIEAGDVPKSAYQLGSDWTMWKWLKS
jgi:hypothetical protein